MTDTEPTGIELAERELEQARQAFDDARKRLNRAETVLGLLKWREKTEAA